MFDDIWKTDFYTNTRKTLYLTATPARSDRGEDAVYQETFKCMPKIDLFNEETDPHTRYVSVLFNSHPTPGQQRWCTMDLIETNTVVLLLLNKVKTTCLKSLLS